MIYTLKQLEAVDELKEYYLRLIINDVNFVEMFAVSNSKLYYWKGKNISNLEKGYHTYENGIVTKVGNFLFTDETFVKIMFYIDKIREVWKKDGIDYCVREELTIPFLDNLDSIIKIETIHNNLYVLRIFEEVE